MRNDDTQSPPLTTAEPAETGEPAPSTPRQPLLILASDDELVCVDDLCLPPERSEPRE